MFLAIIRSNQLDILVDLGDKGEKEKREKGVPIRPYRRSPFQTYQIWMNMNSCISLND
jgi:hypothetical protein